MADATMKHMASNFAKLDKFERVDFRRWQKKMHFLLFSMSVVHVLTTHILEDSENATMEQKDFKNTLKHKKEDLTLVELGSHLRIKESLRVQDSDKPKGNNFVGASVVNMVEHNNFIRMVMLRDGLTQEQQFMCVKMMKNLGSSSVLNNCGYKQVTESNKFVLSKHGTECIFVGYDEHSKALRFYIIEPNESVLINSIIESRDAIFDENRFSFVLRPSLKIPNETEDICVSEVSNEVAIGVTDNGVTCDPLRLFFFLCSLTHHATAWFDLLSKNSIHTFEEMVSKFLSKYFPPSMVMKLRNDISNFRQLPEESLFEAWERYKLSIDRCPNHNMLPVTQIDTFYKGLTLRHRDTINVAAGGTFMKRRPEEYYDLIENMTAHHNYWIPQLKGARMRQSNQQVNMVNLSCETCGGPHHYFECQAVGCFTQRDGALPSNTIPNPQEKVKVITTRSGMTLAGPSVPLPPPSFSSKKVKRDPETTMDQVHISSSESTARVPSLNCSAVLLKKLPEKLGDPEKFLIPCDFSELKGCMALADLGVSINLMPPSVWKKLMLPELIPTRMTLELANRSVAYLAGIAEDVFVKVGKFMFPADYVVVDYDVDPRVLFILGRPFLRTARAQVDVHGEELILRVGDEKLTFNGIETPMDSLDSILDTFDMTFTNPLFEFDSESTLNYDIPIFDIQNKDSDESETETIMDEVQINSSQRQLANEEVPRVQKDKNCSCLKRMIRVTRINTIRLLIALASIHNLIIHQMNVKTTFLNGELDVEVHMNQPQGFIMLGNENKEFLSSWFFMKDMGEADVILDIRIKDESNGITISQSHYIEKVLKNNYFDCNRVSTLMDTSEKLMPIMVILYTSNPITQHWQALQRVLKYLKKIMDYSLTYTSYRSVLEGYTDASWINNTKDNSSTIGWVILLGGGEISWTSKKRTCITSLTMESEFVALAFAGKKAKWLRSLILKISL
nr:zinc finger, CCHC-type [Tanacetum cinerariifolium]